MNNSEVSDEFFMADSDRLAWKYAIAQRSAEIRTGQQATVPLEDVERELGIEDAPIDYGVLDEMD